jgi:hypothetical protein
LEFWQSYSEVVEYRPGRNFGRVTGVIPDILSGLVEMHQGVRELHIQAATSPFFLRPFTGRVDVFGRLILGLTLGENLVFLECLRVRFLHLVLIHLYPPIAY